MLGLSLDAVTHRRPRRRRGLRPSACVLAGPLRRVDVDGRTAILRIDAATDEADGFRGRSITLNLAEARIMSARGDRAPALRAGQVVTATVRLPARIDDLPSVVAAREVVPLGPHFTV